MLISVAGRIVACSDLTTRHWLGRRETTHRYLARSCAFPTPIQHEAWASLSLLVCWAVELVRITWGSLNSHEVEAWLVILCNSLEAKNLCKRKSCTTNKRAFNVSQPHTPIDRLTMNACSCFRQVSETGNNNNLGLGPRCLSSVVRYHNYNATLASNFD